MSNSSRERKVYVVEYLDNQRVLRTKEVEADSFTVVGNVNSDTYGCIFYRANKVTQFVARVTLIDCEVRP